MKEMKAKGINMGTRFNFNGCDWSMVVNLFADDPVFWQIMKRNFRVVGEFHRMCVSRKLIVNAGKGKVMVIERMVVKVLDLAHHIG